MRILVVEDEPALASHLSGALAAAGYAVDAAPDGARADFAVRTEQYDAVLLDHTLGTESGLDWMKDLSARPGFPPILYLVPSSEDADVLPALRAGAEGCISKVKVDHRRFVGALSEAARKRK